MNPKAIEVLERAAKVLREGAKEVKESGAIVDAITINELAGAVARVRWEIHADVIPLLAPEVLAGVVSLDFSARMMIAATMVEQLRSNMVRGKGDPEWQEGYSGPGINRVIKQLGKIGDVLAGTKR